MTALAEPQKTTAPALPRDVRDKIRRGREAMRKDASLRRMCQLFWEGQPYWYVNSRNQLRVLPTALVDITGQKPDHRVRNVYNFIASIVEGKVSAASQKVPGYEIDASSSDPEDMAGAQIAEKVAFYGYDQWHLRRHTIKTITTALVQREAFVMPYFDSNIGPFTQGPNGLEGQGEIRHLDLSRSEVMWEPAVDFDESRWHAIERATLVSEIKLIPGFLGGEIKPNASTADLPTEKRSDEMAMLTEVLERPSLDYPSGRRMFVVDGRVIVDYRRDPSCPPDWMFWWEPYPNMDADGNVTDEPVIHRLSYTVNPEGDDLGLVERLIDLARTINDCWNKLLEWKNRCLMPQRMAPRGSNLDRGNDVPGATFYYNPVGGVAPQWEQKPPVPRELFDMLNMAIDQMRALAADIDVQPDPGLAAKTANAAIEQSQNRWQSFLGDLAEFHSRLMRHDLCLVARHYTQQRIIDIRGQYGWEPPLAFTGQDLRSQVNVRVLSGSIETKTRAQIRADIQMIQSLWPGSISPEAALAAINGGNAENLIRSYELDVARANGLVQRLRMGPAAMLTFQPRYDPELGDPTQGFMVPGWMPRKQDNLAIWKQVIGDYTKTPDYDSQPFEVQHMFDLVFNGLEWLEQRKAQQIQLQQMSMAAQQGLGNAGKPQGDIPMPSQPALSPQQAAPEALSPGQ